MHGIKTFNITRILLIITILFGSCTYSEINSKSDKNKGLETTRKFFSCIDSSNYNCIQSILHPLYAQKIDTLKIKGTVVELLSKYGKAQYRDLVDWRTLSKSGKTDIVEFQYQFKVRRDSLFTLELVELVRENDTTRITTYELQALLPLKEEINSN